MSNLFFDLASRLRYRHDGATHLFFPHVFFLAMTFRHLSSRTLFVASAVAVVGVLIFWWILWSMAAAKYRDVVDGWISTGRAAGYEITYDEERLFGFPRRVVLRFTNVHWTNSDKITFHADDMDITARMGQWNRFEAKFKEHVELIAPLDDSPDSLRLAGRKGVAQVELDDDGVWKHCRVTLDKAEIGKAPDYVFKVEDLAATAERPSHPPKDHTETGLTLTGEADDVVIPGSMPSPFGATIQKVSAQLRVMGDVPDFRLKTSVGRWNNESGIVEFDAMNLDWGVLKMAAKGTVGFDDDLQPEGAFASVVQNHGAVLKILSDQGYIEERKAAMLNSALSLFAKPAERDGATGLELPVTVQLGGLFLGPVRLFAFPPIEWTPPPSSP